MFERIKKLFGPGYPTSSPFQVKEFDRERGVLRTGNDEVSFANVTQESWEQSVSAVDSALREHLDKLKTQAVQLIHKYYSQFTGADWLLPMALDITFATWLRSTDERKEDSQDVIDRLGAIYGEALVQLLGCAWVTVEDEYGKSLAVHHARSTTFVYPFDAIAKRVEKNEIDFFHGIFLVTKASIEGTSTSRSTWTFERASPVASAAQ